MPHETELDKTPLEPSLDILELTHDPEVDAAYLYLAPIGFGDVTLSVPAGPTGAEEEVVLDYDVNGRLLGVEVLYATNRLDPNLLARAVELGNDPTA